MSRSDINNPLEEVIGFKTTYVYRFYSINLQLKVYYSYIFINLTFLKTQGEKNKKNIVISLFHQISSDKWERFGREKQDLSFFFKNRNI